ncbi:hypothetical protein LTS18_013815, partial [Coniosporium uncinatum]
MAQRTPKRTKARRNQPTQSHPIPQTTTDYDDTDAAFASDAPPAIDNIAPPPGRSNDQINFNVLHRHNPSITSITSIAPYSVVYQFSPTSEAWEKSGVEGTLFLCSLAPTAAAPER